MYQYKIKKILFNFKNIIWRIDFFQSLARQSSLRLFIFLSAIITQTFPAILTMRTNKFGFSPLPRTVKEQLQRKMLSIRVPQLLKTVVPRAVDA